MKIHPVQAGTLLLVGAAAVGLSLVAPGDVPRYTKVAPPLDTRVACQPTVPGELLLTGTNLQLAKHGGQTQTIQAPSITTIEQLHTVRGILPSGGIFGTDKSWTPCQQAATNGQVIFPSAEAAQLVLTNPDSREASVDIKIYSSAGELQALGTRGINLAPGETRPVAVSVLAASTEGAIGVYWQTSRGRVIASGNTVGTAQRYVIPPLGSAPRHELPGQAAGAEPKLLLLNMNAERASATVNFHSPTATFVPAGGEDVSIPPHSVVQLDLAQGVAGEPGAFTVEADRPVSALLITGGAQPQAASGAAAADTALSALLPGGSTLQLTNLSAQETSVEVLIGGQPTTLSVAARATGVVAIPEGDPVLVEASAEAQLFGAGVTPDATAVIPLTPTKVPDPDPMEAELVRTLR